MKDTFQGKVAQRDAIFEKGPVKRPAAVSLSHAHEWLWSSWGDVSVGTRRAREQQGSALLAQARIRDISHPNSHSMSSEGASEGLISSVSNQPLLLRLCSL